MASRREHAQARGEEFGDLEGLACLEHVLHVFLTLDEVGILLRHRLHLLLHGEVLIQQRHVQLVQRVDGADVALHDAAQGFRLFLELGDFPVSVFDLGEQSVDALLLRGEFRHHHAVLRLERVVGEAHFFEVEDELVLLEGEPGVVVVEQADGGVAFRELEAQIPHQQHQTRHDEEPRFLGHFRHETGASGGIDDRKSCFRQPRKSCQRCGANPVR